MSAIVHAAFVALLVGTEAFFTLLSALNVRHGERVAREERDWLEETLGVEDVGELTDYHRASTGLSVLGSWVTLGFVLLAVYSGLFADAVAALSGTGLGPLARGVVLLTGAVGVLSVVSWPVDAVDTFVVEEIFGFNEQSPRLWVRDKLLGLAITLVLAAAVSAAVLWLVGAVAWWPVAVWALLVFLSVALQPVYLRVVAPLFYDFDPIETGELREAVDDVFDRAGFECEQVYEMNASSRSGHSNAFFAGFGRTKRVVLFDTLLEGMPVPAVQSVLAHELAHWKKRHVWQGVAAGAVQTGAVVAALWYLLSAGWLYDAFAVPASATAAGLLLAGLWVYPLTRWVSPVENRLYLANEREADAFAVEVMGSAEPMVEALSTLASDNLANPFPHPWYETFHYTHPPIPERIRYLREMGESAGGVDDAGGPESGSEPGAGAGPGSEGGDAGSGSGAGDPGTDPDVDPA